MNDDFSRRVRDHFKKNNPTWSRHGAQKTPLVFKSPDAKREQKYARRKPIYRGTQKP